MAEKAVKVIAASKPIHTTQFQSRTQKKRVAAYARVSTDKEEQESSFENQVEYYTGKIRENPEWIFVDIYADDGITGTSMKKRKGFNRMVEDALAGKIDLILTKSVSRFARNTVDSLTTVRKLKEKGVEVYFENENIYTLDAKGELLITIMSSLAQEEARHISENTAWGRRKQFADGKHSLAYKNFLGYDKGADGELVVNEEQAVTVLRIYREFLAGRSPYLIAKALTADGIKTPAHKDIWRTSTVRSILTNEKYYGAAILQKTLVPDFLTKVPKKNTGELPMYFIQEDHEPIVSEETFKMVQEELRRRQGADGKAHGDSVFSGRIICAECGGFYGRKVWHAGSEYTSYRWHCNNRFSKRSSCTTPTIKEEDLQAAFISVFNGLIVRKDEILDNYRLCLNAITDTTELDRQLDATISACEEIQILIRSLLIDGGKKADGTAVTQQYEEYTARFEENARRREELEEQIRTVTTKRTQIERYLRALEENGDPLEVFDPLVWQAAVDHVVIGKDCTVTFVFRDGSEVKSIIASGVRKYTRRNQGREEPA